MSQARPVISIIVPVWNTRAHLPRCLESIRRQSFADWEAICVNDGSTDDSLSFLLETAGRDPRFVVLDQNNQGPGAARNRGLRQARGQYVMFLDSDDYLHPQCFAQALAALRVSGADICRFGTAKVGPDEPVHFASLDQVNAASLRTEHHLLTSYLKEKMDPGAGVCEKIYKADLAKKVTFKPLQPGEDDLYSFETMILAETFAFLDDELLFYVTNPASITHSITSEKFYANRLQLAEHFLLILGDIIAATQDAATRKLLLKYLTEHFVFKPYIIKGLHQHLSHEQIERHLQRLDELHQQQRIDLGLMRPRYRLALFLARRGLYAPARLLAN